jgi:predicted nucleic acid-binding protein
VPSFFDTNILIYAVDEGGTEKYGLAGELVEAHLVDGDGMISVQVLREFYLAARRLRHPLSDEQARQMVEYFSTFRTLPEDTRMVLRAVRRSQEPVLPFWDALIVEAALKGGADRLLTEDMQHARVIEGMRVENPFM